MDCFANKDNKCEILVGEPKRSKKACDGKCSFYKENTRYKNDKQGAMEQVRKLPYEQFQYINDKYYQGRLRRE